MLQYSPFCLAYLLSGPCSIYFSICSSWAILSCFEIGKRFPRKAGDQVSPALEKHSSVLYFLLFKVAQHRADIGIEQNGLRFKFFRGNGLAQIDAGVSGFRILGCHA